MNKFKVCCPPSLALISLRDQEDDPHSTTCYSLFACPFLHPTIEMKCMSRGPAIIIMFEAAFSLTTVYHTLFEILY